MVRDIGDAPIDNQGMIKLDQDLRVSFRYLLQRLAKNDRVPLTIVRSGKVMQIQLPVSAEHPMLIADLHGEYPSYFIYGLLVFSRATLQKLASFQGNIAKARGVGYIKSPLVTRFLDPPDADLQDLAVVSSPFFPNKLANGYSNPVGSVVLSINDTRVRSLAHLVAMLRDLKDPFVTIEFDQKGGAALVLSRPEMLAATDNILTENGVRSQGSPDMMAV